MNTSIGVIVGRFQIPEPHEGHHALIEYVRERHSKILIVLGCAPSRLSRENPLDYQTRYQMMQKAFPFAVIVPIQDYPENELGNKIWSENLDQLIMSLFPTDQATLYCSQDNLKEKYSGRWTVKEIESVDVGTSTSNLREQAAHEVINSKDFRRGVMYGCANRFPISYQTIDAAILRPNLENGWVTEVLLCRKNYDKGWRFPGGFVDPSDQNLETTVKREVHEETGIAMTDTPPFYLGSYRVNDYRYRNSQDKVMTAFYKVDYMFGPARASDDICEVKWFKLVDTDDQKFVENLIEEHRPLGARLLEYDQQRKKGEKS